MLSDPARAERNVPANVQWLIVVGYKASRSGIGILAWDWSADGPKKGCLMRSWLVNITDPLPIDGAHVRLLRMGTLAGFLAARGHTVTWWTSTFDHYRKRHRFDRDATVDVDGRLSVRLLHRHLS